MPAIRSDSVTFGGDQHISCLERHICDLTMGSNEVSNEGAQFGHTNIPFGVVSTLTDPTPQIATRLFDHVYLIPDLVSKGVLSQLDDKIKAALRQSTLNEFASLGREAHRRTREALQRLFKDTAMSKQLASNAVHVADVTYYLPVNVGDFSDFSCSRDHVLNAGEAVMGIRQLPPGFLHFPVGYGGRCSSILAPGTSVYRPLGQFRTPDGVSFGLSRAVDFELELACVIGKPSKFGKPVDINDSDDHIFGFLLLNDWSARDIQGLEMNPLGPFNGKSFGTSVSPWIITADALEPFRTAGPQKELPPALYLQGDQSKSHYRIQLEAEVEIEGESTTVCRSQADWLYWSIGDIIAHQTINGCSLNAGDVLATGTVSGATSEAHGCLLEISKGGKKPLVLGTGHRRTYLEDADAVRLTGRAGVPGSHEYVGFGQCYGQLLGRTQRDRV